MVYSPLSFLAKPMKTVHSNIAEPISRIPLTRMEHPKKRKNRLIISVHRYEEDWEEYEGIYELVLYADYERGIPRKVILRRIAE